MDRNDTLEEARKLEMWCRDKINDKVIKLEATTILTATEFKQNITLTLFQIS